jgi:hypothetical protein
VFTLKGTVRYEERGQGYRDVEKVGKHWFRLSIYGCSRKRTTPDRMEIQAVDIIIPYRVAGCKLKSEIAMKTQGRGALMKWKVYDADDIRRMTIRW